MSTGPYHYAEAERLLDGVADFTAEGFRNESRIDRLGALSAAAQTTIALAQVHATLALTAATTGQETLGNDWRVALGYQRREQTP